MSKYANDSSVLRAKGNSKVEPKEFIENNLYSYLLFSMLAVAADAHFKADNYSFNRLNGRNIIE